MVLEDGGEEFEVEMVFLILLIEIELGSEVFDIGGFVVIWWLERVASVVEFLIMGGMESYFCYLDVIVVFDVFLNFVGGGVFMVRIVGGFFVLVDGVYILIMMVCDSVCF